MSLDILCPMPERRRNADDMGMPSAPAPSEPAGPSPVVGSGGVVGLRAESAEAFCRELESLADAYGDEGRERTADRIYYVVEIYRRHKGLTTERQPEPNIASQPRDL